MPGLLVLPFPYSSFFDEPKMHFNSITTPPNVTQSVTYSRQLTQASLFVCPAIALSTFSRRVDRHDMSGLHLISYQRVFPPWNTSLFFFAFCSRAVPPLHILSLCPFVQFVSARNVPYTEADESFLPHRSSHASKMPTASVPGAILLPSHQANTILCLKP